MDDRKKENLINKIICFLALAMFFIPHLSQADEVVLGRGTTLSGTIISEDAEEITIITADNMVLHLDKSIIRRVSRSAKSAPTPLKPKLIKAPRKTSPSPVPAVVISTPTIAAPDTHVATATISTSPKLATTPKLITPVENGKTWSAGIVAVTQIQATKKSHIDPRQIDPTKILESMQGEYHTVWSGEPKKDNQEFMWKAVQVTCTTTMPILVTGKQSVINESLRQEIQTQLENEQKIQDEFLHNLADAFPSLSGITEQDLRDKSEQFFNDMMSRAEKRRRGFHRLLTKSSKPSLLPQK